MRLTVSCNSVTVTSTKTAHATETHSEVEIVTVQVNVHVTTTVNSIITTAITSDQGTHTEVTYETTTLIAKRSLSTPALDHYARRELDAKDEPSGIVAGVFSRFWRRLVFGGHLHRPEYEDLLASSAEILPSEGPEVRRRQNDADEEEEEEEEDEESDGTSTVTHMKTTTEVGKTTVTDSTTTTDFVTSTITKTIFQTSTRSAHLPPNTPDPTIDCPPGSSEPAQQPP